MPAKSKRQQRLMGMVRAVQKGMKAPSKKIKDIAESMKPKATKEYAKTKHKGLPEKVKKKKKRKKKKKSYVMIDKLVKLANELDLMGLIDEADSVDKIAAIMSSNMEDVIQEAEAESNEDNR